MKALLPENEPRYIVIKHNFEKDATQRTKLFIILYTPTNSGVRKRMLYASAKSAIKSALNGIQNELDV